MFGTFSENNNYFAYFSITVIQRYLYLTRSNIFLQHSLHLKYEYFIKQVLFVVKVRLTMCLVLQLRRGFGRYFSQSKVLCEKCIPVWSISVHSQQTQNICITFMQGRPNVFKVGPTLYKCYTNVTGLVVLVELRSVVSVVADAFLSVAGQWCS